MHKSLLFFVQKKRIETDVNEILESGEDFFKILQMDDYINTLQVFGFSISKEFDEFSEGHIKTVVKKIID